MPVEAHLNTQLWVTPVSKGVPGWHTRSVSAGRGGKWSAHMETTRPPLGGHADSLRKDLKWLSSEVEALQSFFSQHLYQHKVTFVVHLLERDP